MWNTIWTAVRHNQGIVISLLICIPIGVWFCGCESTTQSLVDPSIRVTRPQLQFEYSAELRRLENELEDLKSQADLRLQDIARQDEIKAALYNHAVGWASGQPINPVGLLTTLGGVLGIGAVIDNRRKDVLIKTLKNE